MLQIRSCNRLERLLKRNKFKKLLPKKTKTPYIDATRRSLSDFDLDGLKVVAIDGTELFESTKKCCDKCLTRNDKNGTRHYCSASIVCATVGSDPHIIIGQEMLEPKKDNADKN